MSSSIVKFSPLLYIADPLRATLFSKNENEISELSPLIKIAPPKPCSMSSVEAIAVFEVKLEFVIVRLSP